MLNIDIRKDSIVRTILNTLVEGEQCECILKRAAGIPRSWPFYDIAMLERSGLIKSRKIGDWTYYALTGNEINKNVHDINESYKKPSGIDPVVLNRWKNGQDYGSAEAGVMLRRGF